MNARKMSCDEVDEKLPLYVGGDLDVDALEVVRAHLVVCEACARRAGEATRAREALRGALAREAGTLHADLWPGIRAVLRAEKLVQESGRPRERVTPTAVRTRPRLVRVAAPLAAAAALVGFLALGGFWRSRPGPTPETAPLATRFEEPLQDAGTVLVTPVSEGLRRVGPEEEDLFQNASSLRRARAQQRGQPAGNDATLPGLAGYR